MTVRMGPGRIPTRKMKACRESTNLRGIPDNQSVPGTKSALILERQEIEIPQFIPLAFRESLDAIRVFAGDDLEKGKYDPEYKDFLLGFKPRVVQCEGMEQS